MKLIKFLVTLLLLIYINPSKVEATLCMAEYTGQKIGIINKIEKNPETEYSTIYLNDIFKHDVTGLIQREKERIYEIDLYESVLRNYKKVGMRGVLERLPEEEIMVNTKILLEHEAFVATSPKEGDIIITGPPFGTCESPQFIAISNRSGGLKSAIISNLSNYSYKDILINPTYGKEIKCENQECTREVDYKIGKESFSLTPGESYWTKSPYITEIKLINATSYKEEEQTENRIFSGRPLISEWITPSAKYVIKFSMSTMDVFMHYLPILIFLGIILIGIYLRRKN